MKFAHGAEGAEKGLADNVNCGKIVQLLLPLRRSRNPTDGSEEATTVKDNERTVMDAVGPSRRDMLKMTAAGAAAVAGGSSLLRAQKAPDKPKRIRIALQLYSVRGDCRKNFDKTVEQVAKMGYDGVEFAGYYAYGSKPKELRKLLDSLGLKAAATHVGFNTFGGSNVQKAIDFHKAIGCKYLCCPGDRRFTHKEQSKAFAEGFSKAAANLKPHGLFCGYHNHSREMKQAQGNKTWWDLFAERTTKDVVLQQDVGWTAHAGKDPEVFVRRYPGRSKVLHFKTHVARGTSQVPTIGKDAVKWRPLIAACYEVGGTEWFTVEQERYIKGKTPLECSELSLKGLKAILKEMGKL